MPGIRFSTSDTGVASAKVSALLMGLQYPIHIGGMVAVEHRRQSKVPDFVDVLDNTAPYFRKRSIKPPIKIFSYPGRSVDMDEDFEDWSIYELQQRTELVQEFDRLADDIVAEALYIAQTHSVEERVIYMPTTKLVLA